MLNTFGSKLLWFDAMKKDPVYKPINATFQQLIDSKGYDPEEALKYGILKRKFLFDKVLERYDIPDLEGEDDNTQSKAIEWDKNAKRRVLLFIYIYMQNQSVNKIIKLISSFVIVCQQYESTALHLKCNCSNSILIKVRNLGRTDV
jgi:hypothetical protein